MGGSNEGTFTTEEEQTHDSDMLNLILNDTSLPGDPSGTNSGVNSSVIDPNATTTDDETEGSFLTADEESADDTVQPSNQTGKNSGGIL